MVEVSEVQILFSLVFSFLFLYVLVLFPAALLLFLIFHGRGRLQNKLVIGKRVALSVVLRIEWTMKWGLFWFCSADQND